MHTFVLNTCFYHISPACFGVLYVLHLQGEPLSICIKPSAFFCVLCVLHWFSCTVQHVQYNMYTFVVMFCWLCISIYACNETNLMHYLSSVYSFTIHLHVSGLLVAHHQEVTMYICNNWFVLYVLVDWPGWDGTVSSEPRHLTIN
jgi:hypothetical protein